MEHLNLTESEEQGVVHLNCLLAIENLAFVEDLHGLVHEPMPSVRLKNGAQGVRRNAQVGVFHLEEDLRDGFGLLGGGEDLD